MEAKGRTDEQATLNHAAFGNGRVLALVSPTSAIEWLCLPRFDSPSVFARILDEEGCDPARLCRVLVRYVRQLEARVAELPTPA